ncbi:MAG: hypothetical protein V7L20_07505 [Nostoc sp.]
MTRQQPETTSKMRWCKLPAPLPVQPQQSLTLALTPDGYSPDCW